MKRPRRGAAVVLGGAVVGTVLAVLPPGAGTGWAATSPVPYTDPAVTGAIGLCDATGHQVTSGSTLDLPMASTAQALVAAPTGYADAKSKATLYAFQPREGVDPGDWSGTQLTGSSYFSSPAHPMAAFTTGDRRLHEVLQIYPARWQGFVQLRLFFSGPNKPAVTLTYPSANLQVTGTTWHQVAPPTVNCGAGKSVSIETLMLPASKFPAPSKAAVTAPADASGTQNGTAVGATGAGDGSTVAGAAGSAQSDSGGGSSSTVLTGLLATAVLGLAVGGVVLVRSRRSGR